MRVQHALNFSIAFRYIFMKLRVHIKRSSAELSEAISFMFRWYRNAVACVVFLSDVHLSVSFKKAPGSKRGWTLQELLAPRMVLFYASDWTIFGHIGQIEFILGDLGKDLTEEVSRITKIPTWEVEYFQPNRSGTCIAQKMH